jgi:putative membrane protein
MTGTSLSFYELMKPIIFTPALALLAAGLLLAVPGVRAQTTPFVEYTNFLQAAAQGGMTEVKLGEFAAKKGTTDEIKDFGREMVKDHGAMNAELKALADKKGVTLPTSLDAKHQELVDKMKNLPGSEFDDTYVLEMVKAHQKDLQGFKDELDGTHDPELQNFLAKSIPVVEMHLKHVAGMQKASASPATDIKN